MEGWHKCNCLPDLVGAEFTDLVCDHSGVNRIARDPRLLNCWQAGDCRCPGLRRRRLATMTRRSWWPQPKISVGDTEWERSKPEPHSPPLYIGINLEVPSETCGNWYKRHQVQHQCGLEMLLLACWNWKAGNVPYFTNQLGSVVLCSNGSGYSWSSGPCASLTLWQGSIEAPPVICSLLQFFILCRTMNTLYM